MKFNKVINTLMYVFSHLNLKQDYADLIKESYHLYFFTYRYTILFFSYILNAFLCTYRKMNVFTTLCCLSAKKLQGISLWVIIFNERSVQKTKTLRHPPEMHKYLYKSEEKIRNRNVY